MTPTQNERIRAAAWQAARGQLAGLPKDPYWCLRFVRLIVERALGLRDGELYQRYLIAGTSRRPGTPEQRLAAARKDVWASDMEASAKLGGWGVPFADRRPGDLLFNYRAAEPQGHVAILIDRNTVIENAPQGNRPISIHLPNSMCITPVEALSWTLAARVPPVEGGGTHSG